MDWNDVRIKLESCPLSPGIRKKRVAANLDGSEQPALNRAISGNTTNCFICSRIRSIILMTGMKLCGAGLMSFTAEVTGSIPAAPAIFIVLTHCDRQGSEHDFPQWLKRFPLFSPRHSMRQVKTCFDRSRLKFVRLFVRLTRHSSEGTQLRSTFRANFHRYKPCPSAADHCAASASLPRGCLTGCLIADQIELTHPLICRFTIKGCASSFNSSGGN